MIPIVAKDTRARAIARRIAAIRLRLEARLRPAVRLFHGAQAGRVISRFLGGVGTLLPLEENELLNLVILPFDSEAILRVGALASQMVGLEPLTATDPRVQTQLARAGRRIVGINDETRGAVRQLLLTAGERGYSPFQIARGVAADDFRGLRSTVEELYTGRADAIARTELATASQHAAHERYAAAGVTHLDIIDGPDCGWTSHDDPDKADGTTRTIDDAESYPIAHPNCQRTSLPVLER